MPGMDTVTPQAEIHLRGVLGYILLYLEIITPHLATVK